MTRMIRPRLCALWLGVVGCATTHLDERGAHVIAVDKAQGCRRLGRVESTSQRFSMKSGERNLRSVENELRNQAASMGGDEIVYVSLDGNTSMMCAGCVSAAADVYACATPAARERSYQELVDAYFVARGGRESLESMGIVERIGTMKVFTDPPVVGTYHTCVIYDRAVAIDVDAGPVQVHQVWKGEKALVCDKTFSTCQPASDDVKKDLIETAHVANREMLYEKESDPVVTREEDRFIAKDKDKRFVFSAYSGLLLSQSKGDHERRYDLYESTGKVVIPMVIEDFEKGRAQTRVDLSEVHEGPQPSEWCTSHIRKAL